MRPFQVIPGGQDDQTYRYIPQTLGGTISRELAIIAACLDFPETSYLGGPSRRAVQRARAIVACLEREGFVLTRQYGRHLSTLDDLIREMQAHTPHRDVYRERDSDRYILSFPKDERPRPTVSPAVVQKALEDGLIVQKPGERDGYWMLA